MQPLSSQAGRRMPHIALLWVSTFSFPLSLAWFKPSLHAASFFLLLFSVPKLSHTTAMFPLLSNKRAKPSAWYTKPQ